MSDYYDREGMVLREVEAAKAAGLSLPDALAELTILKENAALATQMWESARPMFTTYVALCGRCCNDMECGK